MEEIHAMTALFTAVSNLLGAILTWMTDILAWAIAEPLILFFMSVGILGMVFSWVRRLKGF